MIYEPKTCSFFLSTRQNSFDFQIKNKKEGQYLTIQAYMPTSVDLATLERLNFNRKGVRELKPGEYDTFI